MARRKGFKPEFSERSVEFLKAVHQELESRGSVQHNISQLVELALDAAKSELVDQFVSENTPTEYKIRELLKDPKHSAKILAVAGKQKFGISKEEPDSLA